MFGNKNEVGLVIMLNGNMYVKLLRIEKWINSSHVKHSSIPGDGLFDGLFACGSNHGHATFNIARIGLISLQES